MRPLKLGREERSRLFRVFLLCASFLLLLVLYYLFVRLTGKGIPCIFFTVTGLYCPGCGISRMCLALLAGDLPTAFRYNPFILCAMPLFSVMLLGQIVRYIRDGQHRLRRYERVLLVLLMLLSVLFGILRNLPVCSFLAPTG